MAAAWHGHPVAGMKVRKSKRERSEMADNSRRMRRRLVGGACVLFLGWPAAVSVGHNAITR